MRRLILLPLLALGCGRAESPRASRVVLPAGLERPKGLKAVPQKPRSEGSVSVPAAQASRRKGEPSVLGACRYGEEEVACWDLRGEADPRLTGEVKGLLRDRRAPVPFEFGRQNRIVVADLPGLAPAVGYRVTTEGPTGGLSTVEGAGGRQLLFVSTEGRFPGTRVIVVQSRRIGTAIRLAMRKGATAKVRDGVATVESIAKVPPGDPMTVFLQGRPGWKVLVRRTGGPDAPAFAPLDPYPMATADGRRARLVAGTSKMERAPLDAPRVQNIQGNEAPEGGFIALLDVDPAKAKAIGIEAREERRFVLNEIPLNPR